MIYNNLFMIEFSRIKKKKEKKEKKKKNPSYCKVQNKIPHWALQLSLSPRGWSQRCTQQHTQHLPLHFEDHLN